VAELDATGEPRVRWPKSAGRGSGGRRG